MLLYLDTLKKMCFQKKKERCHFILTSCDCDFVFVLLLCFWDGGGEGSGAGIERLVFDSHKHTYLVSVFTCCWARSCFCMDHPVTIVCKQCGEEKGRDSQCERLYIKECFLKLLFNVITLLVLYHFAICFSNNPPRRLKTQNASWVFVSLCMCFFFCFVCCYFRLTFSTPLPLYVIFFPLTECHQICCVSGCLLTDNCKEIVFTGFTQAESSVLS